jgi:hypothetical protein
MAKARKRREARASFAQCWGQPALAPARRLALLSSTAILLAGLHSAPLLAYDECGPAPSAICTSADNPYAAGITYNLVSDLTLIVESGVAIAPSSNNGIVIRNGLSVELTLKDGSAIATSVNNAYGVQLSNTAEDVFITLSPGSQIGTSGDGASGVRIASTGSDIAPGEIILYALGAIETSGDRAHAIRLTDTYGDISVVTSGTITTQGKRAYGVYVGYSYNGSVSIESAGTITTDGYQSSAIGVRGRYITDITITHSGAITTSRDLAHGIYVYGANWAADAPGSDVTLATTAGSSIVTSGQSAHGIYILNQPGGALRDVSLDLAGVIDVKGADSDAVQVINTVGSVAIDISGSVSGGTGAGAAIRVSGDSPVTLDNTGTIDGAVILGDGDDSFTNGGTLRTSFVDMGGGYDTLINSGTIALSGTSGVITGVESFTHSGVIDLANGVAGDTLSISGEFISAGGALYLDAAFDAGTADRLTLGSVAATSDPTIIYVTDVSGGTSAATPILIIDAASDASNGAAFATRPFGAYQYELTYDPNLFDWYLGSLGIYPGTAEYPALVSGALLAFAADLPALHERLQDLRALDGGGNDRIEPAAWTGGLPALRPWLHLTGTSQEVAGGAPFDQEVLSLEGGIDATFDHYSFGAFAGSGTSRQDFDGSNSEAQSDLLRAGLYGSYLRGAYYADAIGKFEHQSADYRGLSTGDEDAAFTVDLLGLSLETGYRFSFERAYLQPRLHLAYAHAWAGGFTDVSGAVIDLRQADSLAASMAARVGAPLGAADLHAELGVRHEFLGETRAEVSGLTFTDELPGTAGQISAGVSLPLLQDKLVLSVDAGYVVGPDGEEFTATTGLRVAY